MIYYFSYFAIWAMLGWVLLLLPVLSHKVIFGCSWPLAGSDRVLLSSQARTLIFVPSLGLA